MSDIDYNPFSYDFHEDPYPTYKRMRDEEPLYRNEEYGFWALSRFEDIRSAFADWETFSSARGISLEDTADYSPDMIITMDPPRQTKIRGLVARSLTPRRVAAMDGQIRELARRYIDRFAERGSADLIQDFAALLPLEVIAALIGVPEEDQTQMRVWTETMLHREPDSSDVPAAGIAAFGSLDNYFRSDLERRREQRGDDLVSGLLDAEIDGEKLSEDEIVGFLFLLAIAGGETTTKLIGNMAVALANHPDQKKLLFEDLSRMPNAVVEAARYDTSTQQMTRTLSRDIELHGQKVSAGEKVTLVIASGNRDEREYADPDVFDIARKIERPLSFGHGVHLCPGAALARMETRVTFEELQRSCPGWEVDVANCVRVHNSNVRGFSRVPIHF